MPVIGSRALPVALLLLSVGAGAACGGGEAAVSTGAPEQAASPAATAPPVREAAAPSATAARATAPADAPRQPSEPDREPPPSPAPPPVVDGDGDSDSDGLDPDTARMQIRSAVDSYIAPGPPQELTNRELRCLSDSVTYSLTDERAVELAPRLTVAELYDGLPGDAFTEDEASLIIAAASGCLDWPALVEENMEDLGMAMPEDPTNCVLEALASPRFAEESARLMLFDTHSGLGAVFNLYGEDCWMEAMRQQSDDLVALGISEQSADCMVERTIEAIEAASQAGSDGAGTGETGELLWELMAAVFECLTEEELDIYFDAVEDLAAGPATTADAPPRPTLASIDLGARTAAGAKLEPAPITLRPGEALPSNPAVLGHG